MDDGYHGASLRVPPHNIQAEQSVIGAMLIDRTALESVADMLRPEDFYRREHRTAYAAVLSLRQAGEPADVVTVGEALERAGKLEDAGGFPYLGSLAKDCVAPGNAPAYAKIVRDHAQARRLLATLAAGMDRLHAPGGAATEVAAAVGEELAAVAQAGPGPTLPATMTAADLGRMQFAPVRWAVPDLLPEGLAILAGRPKMGKSWLSLAVGIAVACGGAVLGRTRVEPGEVLYLALEDRERRLRSRLDTLLMGAAYPERLHLATEWPRGDEGIAALRAWLAAHPAARLVIIDTLARFRAPSRGRGSAYDEDYSAVGAVQSLAVTHGVALLLVHHLRKMGADDPMDTISGTMGVSGAADALLVLSRDRGAADAVLHVTGRDLEDAEHALRWDSPTCTWAIVGAAAEYRMSEERRQIIEALRQGPAYPKTLAALLDRTQGSIRKLLHTMLKQGQVACNGTLYHLPLTGNGGNGGNGGTTGNGGNDTSVTGGEDGPVTAKPSNGAASGAGVTSNTTVTTGAPNDEVTL